MVQDNEEVVGAMATMPRRQRFNQNNLRGNQNTGRRPHISLEAMQGHESVGRP